VRARAAALVILALGAAHAGWNAWSVPPLSGYDAGGHAGYALTLLEERRLPQPLEGWSTFHPPVYYVAAAAVWGALEPLGPRAVMAGLRGIGAAALLAAALAVFALARRTGATQGVAAVAALLFFFLPAVQLSAAMIGNEALAAGLGALALPSLLALQRDPRNLRHAALAGALAGLAVATKWSALAVLAACLVPFLRRDLDARGRRALVLCFGIAALIAGPVFWRNLLLTGSAFPMTRDAPLVALAEAGDSLGPRRLRDYLWLDPRCLLRPSIHHVEGEPPPPPRRNPVMRNVWGLAYASLWYDAFGHRVRLEEHRDGVRTGPALALLGLTPTAAVLAGFALAAGEALRRRGRSPDAPLVALWLFGLAAFVAFSVRAPTIGAAKGSYLLPLAAPGALFFARAASALGARARAALLAATAAALLFAALVFTSGLWFRPLDAETMAARWRLVGALLPGAHIGEAVEKLVGPAPARPGRYSE
jgi:hypothetical protein